MNIESKIEKIARSMVAAKGTVEFLISGFYLRFIPDTNDYNKWDAEGANRFEDLRAVILGLGMEVEPLQLPLQVNMSYFSLSFYVAIKNNVLRDNNIRATVYTALKKAGYRIK